MDDATQALNGKLVTLFGGGGFVGRTLSQALLNAGARVRVAQRNPRTAFSIRPLGNLGQTQFVAADVTRADTVAQAVAGADMVVNLAGVMGGAAQAINVDGARNVAAAAREAGVRALVHLSSTGGDPASASDYGRTKGEGEAAVREAFSDAIILRPSLIFGRDDAFINRFARLLEIAPVVPVFAPETRVQPVFVSDVANAAVAALTQGATGTLDLGGPQVFSMMELFRWIAEQTGRDRELVPLPDSIAGGIARFTGWLPGAPITHDQWLMLQSDSMVDPSRDGMARLGIVPTSLDSVADGWLTQYRRHGRFGLRSVPTT